MRAISDDAWGWKTGFRRPISLLTALTKALRPSGRSVSSTWGISRAIQIPELRVRALVKTESAFVDCLAALWKSTQAWGRREAAASQSEGLLVAICLTEITPDLGKVGPKAIVTQALSSSPGAPGLTGRGLPPSTSE